MAQRRSGTSATMAKLLVLLLCVHGGDSRWLSSGMGQKPEAASLVDGTRDPAVASGRGPSLLIRSRRSAPDSSCGLRSILLQVRELGLGYDSDETVLFKYCGGACPRITSNHDLTLANLLHSGVLAGEPWQHTPCCRPTQHEDMAFLDNYHRWHKVEKLSASSCSCVG